MKAETTPACGRRDGKLVSTNIIVHGAKEVADENEEENDEEFVNTFFGRIGANAKPQSITRLGKPEACETVKIKLEMENEKKIVMSRLSNPKNVENHSQQLA